MRDLLVLSLGLLGLLASTPAAAQSPVGDHEARAHAPERGVRLDREEVWRTAARLGPEVVAARMPREAVARTEQRANPAVVLPATASVAVGSRWASWGRGFEINTSISQEFSTRKLGGARLKSAKALSQSLAQEVRVATQAAVLHGLLSWVDAIEAQSVHELRERSRLDAHELLRIAERRVQGGVGEPSELTLARGELGEAQLAELDAEGAITDTLLALRHALGFEPDRPIVVVGELSALASAAPMPVQRSVERHPELGLALAHQEWARREIVVARAAAAPTFGVGANYMREGTAEQALLGTLSMPLPFGDHGGHAQARQEVEERRLAGQALRVKRALVAALAHAEHERAHARATYAAVRDGVQEPYRQALALARQRWERGVGELAPVLLARRRALDAEERVIHSAAAIARADLHYAASVGELALEAR